MIHRIENIKVGDKVRYIPPGGGKFENGVIKRIDPHRDDAVWVIYYCDGQWDRYYDFTGCLTKLKDLYIGWR